MSLVGRSRIRGQVDLVVETCLDDRGHYQVTRVFGYVLVIDVRGSAPPWAPQRADSPGKGSCAVVLVLHPHAEALDHPLAVRWSRRAADVAELAVWPSPRPCTGRRREVRGHRQCVRLVHGATHPVPDEDDAESLVPPFFQRTVQVRPSRRSWWSAARPVVVPSVRPSRRCCSRVVIGRDAPHAEVVVGALREAAGDALGVLHHVAVGVVATGVGPTGRAVRALLDLVVVGVVNLVPVQDDRVVLRIAALEVRGRVQRDRGRRGAGRPWRCRRSSRCKVRSVSEVPAPDRTRKCPVMLPDRFSTVWEVAGAMIRNVGSESVNTASVLNWPW